ncbi:MAG TPA: lycopene cyclase domain-containing protein [Chitinophagales bacterium]|nr:lycopene cyclase domain-containing protein [Chitinophagales bacterium]
MKYTYLLINLFTICFPLLASFESRIAYARKWKYFLPANLFVATLFIIWDHFFTKAGIWGFNPAYTIGWHVGALPVEEILFFITVPFSCTFIYETVLLFSKSRPGNYINRLWLGAGIVMLAASLFAIKLSYTFSVLLLLGLLMVVTYRWLASTFKQHFLIAFAFCMLPMAIVDGLLTGLPVVIYNHAENTGVRLGPIPVEDFVYAAILLLLNMAIYDWLKQKGAPHNN